MNSSKKFQIGALAALVSAAVLAGCSGGGSKSSPVPSVPTTSQLGNSVATTLTFMVGDTAQSAGRNAKYVPASAQSIVVKYVGDNPSATPVPGGGTIPASAITAATVNVNTAAGGNCTAVGSALRCTIAVSLPVGTLDLYIQAFSGTNGSGTLLASSVSVIQLNSNGTFTAPGTTTAATPAPLSANIAGAQAAVTLAGPINPLPAPAALPLATSAPTSLTVGTAFPSVVGNFSFSALQTATFTNADGTALTGAQPISPVTITDTDTSGATCLIYVKQGATTATPCPIPSAGATSSVTLTNSQDQYAVQWNGKFLARAGFNITAAIPGSQATSTPAPQKVTPGIATAAGPIQTGGVAGSNGTLIYDPVSSAVYIGTASNTKPLVKVPYSAATGYGTASAITVATVNGAAAANLTGGVGSTVLTLGPDGNIWIAESSAAAVAQYVAVYVVNATTANATNGSSLSTGAGAFAEYRLSGSGVGALLVGIANAGNYIWVTDNLNDVWRINPSTASVNPNKAAAYVGAPNAAVPVTTAAAGALTGVFASNAIALGGSVWSMSSTGLLTKLTLDTSAAPSAGVCTAAGPPTCIAAATQSAGIFTATQPYNIVSDGTNIDVTDSAGVFGQWTQSFALTKAPAAIAQGANWANGLGLGPDGVFWTEIKTNGGVEGLTTLAGGATNDLLPGANAACASTATVANGGTGGFIIGPDGTLLFAPFQPASGNAQLCGVIY